MLSGVAYAKDLRRSDWGASSALTPHWRQSDVQRQRVVPARIVEFFIFFAWIMCVFYVFADIFRSHDMGGVAKTVWCLFVIFVPFLGVLVYLIARGGGMTQRTLEQQQRMQDQQAEYVRSVAATSGGGSSADQIASAKQLLDAGTITQAEFDQLKAKALT